MDHRTYTDWLVLSLYEELDDDARMMLEEHLRTCASCPGELERLRAFHATATKRRPVEVTERLIQDARRERRLAWRARAEDRTPIDKLAEMLGTLFPPRARLALGGAALLVAGFAAGWAVLRTTETGQTIDSAGIVRTAADGTSFEQGDGRIQNLRFLNRDAKTGDVEVVLETVTPIRFRGNVNDERVQRILAHALIGEENAGTRLRAVNMLADRGETRTAVDENVKQSLISALKYDPNFSVRKEALSVLENYLPDADAVQAILYILAHEKNTGMKVAAINALDPKKNSSQPRSSDVVNALRQAAENEPNTYIRIRAQAALQEVHK